MALGSVPSVWSIVPTEAPRVRRPCSGCGAIRPFASRGRFRVNANGRRLDAWLIYGCSECGTTWNRPVLERIEAGRRASLVARLEANDPEEASRLAHDVGGLDSPSHDVSYRVERSAALDGEVELRLTGPLRLRLDRLLASELGISRTELLAWQRSGRLQVFPPGRLNRPVVTGQRIRLDTPAGSGRIDREADDCPVDVGGRGEVSARNRVEAALSPATSRERRRAEGDRSTPATGQSLAWRECRV